MKICKQCGRELDESCFRPTKARSSCKRGLSCGTATICRNCESLNQRAHNALKANNVDAIEMLRNHYMILKNAGRPPVTAAARRLLAGVEDSDAARRPETNGALAMTASIDAELLEHVAKVRDRSYSSFAAADEVHRRLTSRLREAGLYSEVNDLLDEWYLDE